VKARRNLEKATNFASSFLAFASFEAEHPDNDYRSWRRRIQSRQDRTAF
jgi:hypothetical protein